MLTLSLILLTFVIFCAIDLRGSALERWCLIPALVALVVALSGCGGQCIKVGATHEGSGIGGDFTYCFNQEESDQAGVPAFNVQIGDGAVEKLYGFTEDYVKKINSKIDEWLNKFGLKSIAQKEQEHPVLKLKRLVEGKEDKR